MFDNGEWPDIPIEVSIQGVPVKVVNANGGLCGGMTYAVRDYWEAGVQTPRRTDHPVPPDPLFQYILQRLLDSWEIPLGIGRYLDLMNPLMSDHDTVVAHGRGWVMSQEEWPKIKADIDSGQLSPVSLVLVESADPSDLADNHQVLAYGYEMAPSLTRGDVRVTLSLYDPNLPGDDGATMSFTYDQFDPGASVRVERAATTDPLFDPKPVHCFFRSNYWRSTPPSPATSEAPPGESCDETCLADCEETLSCAEGLEGQRCRARCHTLCC